MLRVLLTVFCLIAPPAFATCSGQNGIDLMPDAERAEMRALVDAVPFARGNFWQATRNAQTILLIGTYHLPDPRFDAMMPGLAERVLGIDTLLVEAGPVEQAALQDALARDPSLIFMTEGPTLPESLPAETWDALKAALNARGIPAFLGAKMRPAYLAMLLGVPPCATEAMMGEEAGLDQRIMDLAKTAGVEVRALEPFDTVFGIFESFGVAEQREMLEMTLALDGQSESAFATMQDAYFAEDSRLIWEYNRWLTLQTPGMDPARVEAEFTAMEEALMNARNRAWIPVILEAAAEGRVLAAFGALHLSGQQGILALLEAEGFALERLTF